MKIVLTTLFFVLISFGIQAQSSKDIANLKAGDILKVGLPSTNNFKYFKLPKANFIIKNGGLANKKRFFNKSVEVLSIHNEDQDKPYITVKFTEGKVANTVGNFDIELRDAVDSGELLL